MKAEENIERDFKRKVCADLKVVSEGNDRYLVLTPLTFDDGDALPIVLRKEANRWLLSDEGRTLLQLSYDIDEEDLEQGARSEILTNTLHSLGLENRRGELVLPIEKGAYGNALYTFIQALLKVDDIRYLSQDRVRSTFHADVRRFLERTIPENRRQYDWHHPIHDTKGLYTVDCRVNGGSTEPLFIFALPAEDRVNVATVTILQFEKWQERFRSLGIFEDHAKISKGALARFVNVCDKVFTDLQNAEDRFAQHFPDIVEPATTSSH